MKTFEIDGDSFYQDKLRLGDEFAQFLAENCRRTLLILVEPSQQKHVCNYDPQRNELADLGPWYRTVGGTKGRTILFSPLNPEEGLFEIRLKEEDQKETAEGLYVGRRQATVGARRYELGDSFTIPISDLLTHGFICGITGSGKTVLGKSIVEEAALQGIPSIIIDLKGDLSSMGLVGTKPEEFLNWVDAKDEKTRARRADQYAYEHFSNLEKFSIDPKRVEKYKEKVAVKVFTPRSQKGIPIGFSSPLGAPPYPTKLLEESPEDFNNLVASLVNAFLDRLYHGKKKTALENERNFLYEIVHNCWRNNIDLRGEAGMRQLLEQVQNPPFDQIGGLPVPQYIDAEGRRARLVNKINTLLSGAERMWFEGGELEIEKLVQPENARTRINVINISDIDAFEDRSFVVAQVAYKINTWMRKEGGTYSPRVLFFIDEIGGGGGKQAFFPSYPYESAAKWGLNYLIRQGRAFGVCCVLATQNPGDVDYKGLSNCHTWMIGKLATDRDRKKVMEGMELWGNNAEVVSRAITSADTGQFVVKDPRGKINHIKVRWLMSYHRPLTLDDLSRLSKK
jgi:hypothetical protein